MIDWKTTLPGVVAGLVAIVHIATGFQIPQNVVDTFLAFCLALIGMFATTRGNNG